MQTVSDHHGPWAYVRVRSVSDGATVYHAIGDADARDGDDDACAHDGSASVELASAVDHARYADKDDATAYDASEEETRSSDCDHADGSHVAMDAMLHPSMVSVADEHEDDAPSHDADAPHAHDAAHVPRDAAAAVDQTVDDRADVAHAVDDRDDRSVAGRCVQSDG